MVNGEIALAYIPTAKQQADGLTKALPLQTHQTLCLNKFLVQYVFPEHYYEEVMCFTTLVFIYMYVSHVNTLQRILHGIIISKFLSF